MADNPGPKDLSLVNGSIDESIWTITLGALAEVQADIHGDKTAVVFPWQGIRRSYRQLHLRSKTISRALIEWGLGYGDCVGIFAGNCCEYLEVFLGAAAIGCTVVVLNSSYTPKELQRAVEFSECKLLCAARYPGPKRDITAHLDVLVGASSALQIVVFDELDYCQRAKERATSFDAFFSRGESSHVSEVVLSQKQCLVRSCDILNLQFTSGTTGAPKASTLSHSNLINNGRFTGNRIALVSDDVICCPAPLFHCFGLVMGFLGAFTRGCAIVFPSQQFDAGAIVDTVEAEQCTVLYGVPTMFNAELDALAAKQRKLSSVKTALVAGSPVLPTAVKRLEKEMGVVSVLIAYGMTETSPVTFGTSANDTLAQRLGTVGTVLPHTGAKIVDSQGNIVRCGIPGEICTSGYALQQGYLKNIAKTEEAMRIDSNGIRWMHTGDEGVIDGDGYCRVTGRIKDMIIRGGENIVPTEIEEQLLSHDSITDAAVVGTPHPKYGEQVVAFVRQGEQTTRPSTGDVAAWVRETLGRHKAPEHVFWVGDAGVGEDFPKTASGKHQKHALRDVAATLLRTVVPRARLWCSTLAFIAYFKRAP